MDEEGEIYDLVLQDLYENPRWYLDNFEDLRTFRVSWYSYEKMSSKVKKHGAPKPRKFVKTFNKV